MAWLNLQNRDYSKKIFISNSIIFWQYNNFQEYLWHKFENSA